MSATPVLPPGLEAQSMTFEDIPNAPDAHEMMRVLRDTILKEVERTVEARTELLWAKGKQVFSQAQIQHREEVQKLTEKVSRCQEKHKLLAEENERLREALSTVAKCIAVPEAAVHSPSTFAATSPHSDDASSYPSRPFTPYAPGVDFYEALPEVPPMPFAGPPGTPAPLSLAEALGPPPQRTPLSLAESLAAKSSPGSDDGLRKRKTFQVAINKTAEEELGLDVSHEEDGYVLVVDGLRHGAVEVWNQQCVASGQAEKALRPGDKICECNGITGPNRMLEECVSKRLLCFSIIREESPSPKRQLRAEASEFVPGGALSD